MAADLGIAPTERCSRSLGMIRSGTSPITYSEAITIGTVYTDTKEYHRRLDRVGEAEAVQAVAVVSRQGREALPDSSEWIDQSFSFCLPSQDAPPRIVVHRLLHHASDERAVERRGIPPRLHLPRSQPRRSGLLVVGEDIPRVLGVVQGLQQPPVHELGRQGGVRGQFDF